jgi:hypothetical protein
MPLLATTDDDNGPRRHFHRSGPGRGNPALKTRNADHANGVA